MTREEAIKDIKENILPIVGGKSLQMAIKALEQPELRWIPCGERMPEYGVEVLTIGKYGDYEINHIVDDDGEWFWYGVIAWMPLPEPYKGDEE